MNNRPDRESRIRAIVSNLIWSPPALCDGSNRETMDREKKAVRQLMEVMCEDVENFSCAFPIAEQIEIIDWALHRYPGATYFERDRLAAAIESLRWLDCYMRGREGSDCTDETGAEL